MLMTERLHTKKDAYYCLWYFKKHISGDSRIVGSFGKGAEQSMHDIDIHIPVTGKFGWMKAIKYRNKIQALLGAKITQPTDLGGWFFTDTIFGNVDVFFDTEKFDY